ncbi:MAG: tetratricopeptide repeat protein [bacterium]
MKEQKYFPAPEMVSRLVGFALSGPAAPGWLGLKCGGQGLKSLALLGCLALASCQNLPPSNQPLWIAQPKTDDSLYLYRVGHAMNQPSSEAARDAAFQEAMKQMAAVFPSRIAEDGSSIPVDTGLVLKNVEIIPDCVSIYPDGSVYEAWVQVSYPISEKLKVLRQIEAGDKLNAGWAEARTLARQGKYCETQKILTNVFAQMDQALFVKVDMDEANILLGDTYREQKDALEARRAFEQVVATTTSDKWKQLAAEKLQQLPDPPRFWPMQDRWNHQSVGLLCAIRDGKECRRFGDLCGVLAKDCREAKIACRDFSENFDPATSAAAFDRRDFQAVCKEAQARDAQLILAVLYDIDPAKQGKSSDNFGMAVPTIDALVRYFIVRASDGKIMFDGQIKDVTGGRPESSLAERTAMILITRYLVPNCPAIAAAPPQVRPAPAEPAPKN